MMEGRGIVADDSAKKEEQDAFNTKTVEFGYLKKFYINKTAYKRILITGANSYIGKSFVSYVADHYPNLVVETIDMVDGSWRQHSFHDYDTVFHVAGIAHSDVDLVSDKERERYYAINRDLAVETAKKAKDSGVRQFIFMGSIIIYGDSAPWGKEKIIDENSSPCPSNFYGDSKWQADKAIRELGDRYYHVAVIRAPMIYGRGAKGNYQILSKLAKRTPIFPDIKNNRSMLYIDNLCEFVCLLSLSGESGIYFPQNAEYSNTSSMVKIISQTIEKRSVLQRFLIWD